ncbi:unnamed protein product [Mytilus edulis]|uniref:Uncharacterized protein n=1 Tax=Mytilus edulis TaxID=6550 RepID=A0A8S3SN01_MYTED|nr:unnamed protein product [Mytilus edulis]
MVADILPPSSHVSVFQILLFIKVITSVLTTIMAIITISVYNKNENDIYWLMILYKSVFGKCKCKSLQQEHSSLFSSESHGRQEETTTEVRLRHQQIRIDVPGRKQQIHSDVPGCSGQMPNDIRESQQLVPTDIQKLLECNWKLLAHKINGCCITVLILELLFEMVALTVIFVRKSS